MQKKILPVLFVLILSYLNLYSQPQVPSTQKPLIIPPSPEAAALGKYGQTPVSMNTGVPDISVPIYQIVTPRFTLPISLSYNATGVKVDEMATWVGQNWSLNAGGVITRTINGLPDESLYGFLNISLSQLWTNLQTDEQLNYDIMHGVKESEPDYFFYNFNKNSGKFVFGEDHNPLLMPLKKLKVTFNVSANNFQVIDEEGNSYKFGDVEYVTADAYPQTTSITAPSSWYLSEMVSADKSDTIKFNYITSASTSYENSYSYNTTVGSEGIQNKTESCQITPGILRASSAQIYVRHYLPVRVSSIIYKGGKIEFESNTARTDASGKRLDAINVYNYDFNAKSYSKLKTLNLNTSYFYSSLNNQINNTLTNLKYRLKLDGVTELDKNGQIIKNYAFEYSAIMPPPVNNFAQDIFGFYNGKTTNSDLIQNRTVTYENILYTIGNADRNADPQFTEAGILKKIYYPTGGTTEFAYEPNSYLVNGQQSIQHQTVSIAATPGMTPVNTTTFVSDGSFNVTIQVEIPKYANLTPPVNTSPLVKFTNVTTGQIIYQYSGNPNQNTAFTMSTADLIAGNTYQLYAAASGNNSIYASITVSYDHNVSTPDIRIGGGLRIKDTKDYDTNGTLLTSTIYKYGTNEDGVGTLVSFPNSVMPEFVDQMFVDYAVGSISPCGTVRRVFSSSSIFPLATLGGSPVGYTSVTKYTGTIQQNAGKSVFEYEINQDGIYPSPLYYNGGIMSTDRSSLRNSEPTKESYFANDNGQYRLVKQKTTDFTRYGGNLSQAIKVVYQKIPSGIPNNPGVMDIYGKFYYPIESYRIDPTKITENDYDITGVNITAQQITDIFYDNVNHFKQTRRVTTTSEGKVKQIRYNYQMDMAANNNDPTGVYASMGANNIISPVVEAIETLAGVPLQRTKANYYNFGTTVYLPQSVEYQKQNLVSEIRLTNTYDTKGNLLSTSPLGGVPVNYLWGYNGLYPIAEIKNGQAKDVFIENFETGNGNSFKGDCLTGIYSKTNGFSINITGLSSGKYILNYWKKNGAVWELVTIDNISVSSGNYSIIIDSSFQVDNIRFFPVGAQLTTYTYAPLVGMTSTTDPKGLTTKYEYDGFQRLINVRDQDGNIIKHNDYHYQNQ